MQTVICQKLPVGVLLKIENYSYSVSSKLGCFSLSSWKLVQQMPLVRVGKEKGIKKKYKKPTHGENPSENQK